MKSVAIDLDESRQEKLNQILESTVVVSSELKVAGHIISVQPPKLSATAVANALLKQAIDDAHARL